ncbi:hypothetical protein FACS1894219_11340 [Clostridia bacterium]|nr:hypothetical protein FACS1894219_11340 [Clostridia bacterium]
MKIILVACGTVSSIALETLRKEFPEVPIIGVVEPSCEKAVRLSKISGNRKIGVIGTAATVSVNAYGKYISKHAGSDFEIYLKACPLFVPLVENGHIENGNALTTLAAREYLSEFADMGLSNLILGCTHYPMIKDIIDAVVNPEGSEVRTAMIDVGFEAAHALESIIISRNLANDRNRKGSIQVYLSDEGINFGEIASSFLGVDIRGKSVKVDIEAN